MWIDTHAHLDAAEFAADRDAVIARAQTAGVAQIVLPAVDVGNFAAVRNLAHAHSLSYALGIHPLCTGNATDGHLQTLRAALEQHHGDPRLVAVGEIGLDGFVAGLDMDRQVHFFTHQLHLAREFELPVLVHSRRALDLVLKHVRRMEVTGIAHAFNGSEQQAGVFVERGFRLGFGGAMTFERALQIRRLASSVPAHALVLETDAPDIPPHWLYRTAAERAAGASMRNEPAQVPRIAQTLAVLRGVSDDEIERLTTRNALDALPRLAALA